MSRRCGWIQRTAAVLFAVLVCMVCLGGLCACGSDALSTTANASTSPSPSSSAVSSSDSDSADVSGTEAAAEESTTESEVESSAVASEPEGEESPESSDGEESGGDSAPTMSVSILVDASAMGQGVFASTTVSLPQGSSVFDALCATGVVFSGSGSYVSSINGLAEFDGGATSGWLYSVNGTQPGVSCGSYALSPGDYVVWYYTLSY